MPSRVHVACVTANVLASVIISVTYVVSAHESCIFTAAVDNQNTLHVVPVRINRPVGPRAHVGGTKAAALNSDFVQPPRARHRKQRLRMLASVNAVFRRHFFHGQSAGQSYSIKRYLVRSLSKPTSRPQVTPITVSHPENLTRYSHRVAAGID